MSNNSKENLKKRPPIVVVMGHVDHGKTTLLDYIRKSNVAAREAGGITQAIAAYEIVHNGERMTFIDTPGHEAFSAMRSRGAQAADLAILVVAGEEGVKPQTAEAIAILLETKTPFVVAINKVDKPEANVEKVKGDLANAGVLVEGYGGQVSFQPISAKAGTGVSELLDLLLLAADVEGLTYDPSAEASGYVLETRQNPKRGLEVSLIVKNGTLHYGDVIGTGSARGKIKMLEDFKAAAIKTATPSAPVLVVGFETLPHVGEEFSAGDGAEKLFSDKTAANEAAAKNAPVSVFVAPDPDIQTFNIVLKAGDAGSLEALSQIISAMAADPKLAQLSADEKIKPIKVVAQGVGEINDNDVKLIRSLGGVVIGFKSKANKAAAALAQTNGVKIITSEIIYELIKSIEEGLNEKDDGDVLGEMEVLALFNQEKVDKQLVGGKVLRGVLKPKNQFDLLRAGTTLGSGRITTIRTGKNEVMEIGEGNEAGIFVSVGVPIAVGDKVVVRSAR